MTDRNIAVKSSPKTYVKPAATLNSKLTKTVAGKTTVVVHGFA